MKYFILILLFLIFQTKNQAQVTEVTYKRAINLNEMSENIKEKYGEVGVKKIKERYNNYNKLTYSLLFNDNESLFFLNPIEAALESEVEDNDFIQIVKREKNKKYYYNKNEDKLVYQTDLGGEKSLVLGKPNQLEWSITKNNKMISNFKSYKAVLIKGHNLLGYSEKVTIEVWFTPEIPVPFGPKQLEGLPGLILEAKFGNNIYYVSHIKQSYDDEIAQPKKGKEITRQKFVTILLKFKEEFLEKNN